MGPLGSRDPRDPKNPLDSKLQGLSEPPPSPGLLGGPLNRPLSPGHSQREPQRIPAGKNTLPVLERFTEIPTEHPPNVTVDASGQEARIEAEILDLEDWAKRNERDAWRDGLSFWALKVPAIPVSAGAGIVSFYELKAAAVIASGVASACVVIDALRPMGQLRNVHRRAVHELRALQAEMRLRWVAGREKNEVPPNMLAASILERVLTERQRIGHYVEEAEASLGVAKSGKPG